ncbi:MAG: adenylyltransferase/cytidyltransferase family protein [Candidatus Firestonebacteria bacterium]
MLKKLKTLGELKKIVKLLKSKEKKIVFVNGCFDVLHVGHIRYLSAAKSLGDILIVGLNSDASVRKNKGNGRPLLKDTDRAEMLNEIEYIDYILIFSQPTVDKILLELKPDFHAKGTDYTKDTVPEVDTVKSYGGKVAIVGDPKEHSTTDLIKLITSKYH